MTARQDRALENSIEKLKNQTRILREKLAALRKENKSLQNTLEATQRLLNKIPGSVVLIQDGKIIYTNEILLMQLGYSKEEMIGKDFIKIIHPRSREFVLNIYERKISGKSAPDEYETYLAAKNGETLCCEVRVNKIRHKGRSAFLFNIIGLDDKKRKEKQQSQSHKRKTLARMASGLSREFEDCLKIVDEQFLNIKAIEYAKNSGHIESLKRLETAIGKGYSIVRQLDSLADFERQRPGAVLFDLRKAVKDAVALARQNWKEQPEDPGDRTQLKTYLRTISPVEGHPEEIRDAIVSIILNAVDALPAGGEIYLTMEENAGFAHIYLQDNGEGIDGEIQDKIFDPFFTTKGGLRPGLGLSLALAVITRHGGEIEFVTLEDQGATCSIKLPLARKTHLSKVKGSRNRINNSRILIITEEGVVKDILAPLFVSKGGKVTVVSTAGKGLKVLRKHKFDLAIADLNTPAIEPIKIIPKIKKTNQSLPLALVNAEKGGKSSHAFEKMGADLIISKPLDMDRVVSLVSGLLARNSSSPA